jgi:hypothetical protein
MSDQAPDWVIPVMRAGYFARAAVYTAVGGLALGAAIDGDEAEGTTDALAELLGEGWGVPLLWGIALGLFAYTIWRLIDAWMDLECYGNDAKGLLSRAGLVVTGVIHAGIGVSVASVALRGKDSGEGGSGTESVTAQILAMPYGVWLVAGVGVATIGAGGYYVWKGVAEKYKKQIRLTPMSLKLSPVMKFGCIAEGVVIAIIGVSIVFAALNTDPQQAKGLGEALGTLRAAPFGRLLLGVVALGLLAFAVENAVEAIYRAIPALSERKLKTLATDAKLKAARHLRRVTS